MDAQYFLIGTDGRHYGPLSTGDVRAWLADGRASRYSRARRDTETQWLALRDMPEFEEQTRPAYIGGSPAAATHGADGVVHESAGPDVTAAAGSRLDPVACFRRAWFLVSRDFAVLAGWTLLVVMAIVAIGIIPRFGWIAGLLVNNLLLAGVYALFLGRMRGRRPSMNDIATAVRASALRIIIAGLIQSLLTVPVVFASQTPSARGAAALLVLFVPCLYLLVGYAFVLPLIIDRQMPIWGAMELSRRTVHRQWFPTFGLLLAAGMLLFLSGLALGFGLVLTLPLCTAALMFAYEDLFGQTTQGTLLPGHRTGA
jgi:hypothetical protein